MQVFKNSIGETIVFEKAKTFKKFFEDVNRLPEHLNRDVNFKHVLVMKESIESIGVQRSISIVRTSRFGKKNGLYIADGQHLTEAILSAIKLYGHFVVMITDIDSKEQIVRFESKLNSTSINWNINQFLERWKNSGNKNYVKLANFVTEHNVKLNSIIELVLQRTSKGNTEFKNGDLKISDTDFKRIEDFIQLYKVGVSIGLAQTNATFNALVRFKISFPDVDNYAILSAIKNSEILKNTSVGGRDAYISAFRHELNISMPRGRKAKNNQTIIIVNN